MKRVRPTLFREVYLFFTEGKGIWNVSNNYYFAVSCICSDQLYP